MVRLMVGGVDEAVRTWPSHFILFSLTAVSDLVLFSGVSIQIRPREACVCVINSGIGSASQTFPAVPQLPSGCARLTGPDATPHHTLQLTYTFPLISPTRFFPVESFQTCITLL